MRLTVKIGAQNVGKERATVLPEQDTGLKAKWASPVAQMVKNCLQCGRSRFDPWVGKIPWRKAWLPTPVFLPGEFHGQRSLASP